MRAMPRSCPGHTAQQPLIESLGKAVKRLEARLEIELNAGLRAAEARLDSLSERLDETLGIPQAAEARGEQGAGAEGAAPGVDAGGGDAGDGALDSKKACVRRLDAEIASLWRTHLSAQKENRTANSLWGQISERLAVVEQRQRILATSARRALQASMSLQQRLAAEAHWGAYFDKLRTPMSHATLAPPMFPVPNEFGLDTDEFVDHGSDIMHPAVAPFMYGSRVRSASPSNSVSTMGYSVSTNAFNTARSVSMDSMNGHRAACFWAKCPSSRVKLPPTLMSTRASCSSQERAVRKVSSNLAYAGSTLGGPRATSSTSSRPRFPLPDELGLDPDVFEGSAQTIAHGHTFCSTTAPTALGPRVWGTAVGNSASARPSGACAAAPAKVQVSMGAGMSKAASSLRTSFDVKMDAVVPEHDPSVKSGNDLVLFSAEFT